MASSVKALQRTMSGLLIALDLFDQMSWERKGNKIQCDVLEDQ